MEPQIPWTDLFTTSTLSEIKLLNGQVFPVHSVVSRMFLIYAIMADTISLLYEVSSGLIQ